MGNFEFVSFIIDPINMPEMKITILCILAVLLVGYCTADSCQDNRNDCLKINCVPKGLEWSMQNCAKTCNYCNETKCVFTDWEDIGPCSATCGIAVKPQRRHPVSIVPAGTVLDYSNKIDDCNKLTRMKPCNLSQCTTPQPAYQPVVQHAYVHQPVVRPEHVLAAAGTAATTAAIATIGATLGETLLSFVPLLAFGKRSTIDERDVLDVFIQKIQEKRKAME